MGFARVLFGTKKLSRHREMNTSSRWQHYNWHFLLIVYKKGKLSWSCHETSPHHPLLCLCEQVINHNEDKICEDNWKSLIYLVNNTWDEGRELAQDQWKKIRYYKFAYPPMSYLIIRLLLNWRNIQYNLGILVDRWFAGDCQASVSPRWIICLLDSMCLFLWACVYHYLGYNYVH